MESLMRLRAIRKAMGNSIRNDPDRVCRCLRKTLCEHAAAAVTDHTQFALLAAAVGASGEIEEAVVVDAVLAYLQHGGQPDSDHDQVTLLKMAALSGRAEVCTVFCGRGCNLPVISHAL